MNSATNFELNNDKLELQACPICSSRAIESRMILHYPELGYPGDFIIKSCNDCGLLFNSPRLRDDLLELLYDRNYYIFLERPRQAVARIKQLYQQTVAVLETLTTDRRILEVGSAKGYLLAFLAERGWSVHGVEISQYAADYAQTHLGIQTYCGTLEDWINSPEFEPMPLVVSTDVIEHVNDLDSFVRGLSTALLDDGLLLLGTPNGDARGIELHGGRWLGFNPFHINILSRNNLKLLLERYGFSVVLTYTYNNLEPAAQPLPNWRTKLASILDKVGLLLNIRQMKHYLEASIDEWTTPLKNRIAFVAQSSPSNFFETLDGLASDAMDCRGDNLVFFARKNLSLKQRHLSNGSNLTP